MTDRAIVLVDGGYFGHINQHCRDEYDSPIDLVALSEKLCENFDTDWVRTKFYDAHPFVHEDDPTDDQEERLANAQSFFDTIDSLPHCQFEERGRVKREHADCPECGEHFRTKSQKGVDVGIAVDLVEMACDRNAPEAFILITGDEDLTHAARAAKDNHANVYLGYAFERSADLYSSQELRNEVDDMQNIANHFLSNVTL